MANKTEIIISAKDETKQAFDSVIRSAGGLKGIFAGIGFGLVASELVDSVKSAANFADEMGKVAQKVGVTTEAISGLKYAADLSDVSFEGLQTGLKKLSQNAFEAADGSKEMGSTFKRLGVDITSANGGLKSSDTLLLEIADRFASMKDGAEKTALAVKLFGKSGVDLIPLLNGGSQAIKDLTSEAEAFGLVVSKEGAKSAEEFNDNLMRLESASKGLSVEIGNRLVPGLADASTEMVEAIKKGNEFEAVLIAIAAAAKAPFDLFVSSAIDTSSKARIKEIESEINRLERGIKETKTGGLIQKLLYGGNAEELQAQLTVAKNQLEAFKKFGEQLDKKPDEKNTAKPESPFISTAPTGKSEAQKKLEEQARAAQAFTDKLKEQAATLGITGTALLQFDAAQLKLTESQKQSVNASILSIENFEKNKKAIEDATKAAEFQQELMRQIGEDSQKQAQLDAEPARKAQESYMSFMEAIRVESENLNIELIKDDKARIKAQLELEHQRSVDRINGLGLESEQAQALIEAEAELFKKKIENIDKSAKGTKNIAQELGLTFTSAFEDAALSGEKFSDVLAGLAKDIERMILRKTVTEPLGNIFDDLIGGFDFGSIFANANGGVYSGAGISAYSGKVVSQPTLFPFAKGVGLMGEAGPEAIMPLKRGRGGKLGIEGGGQAVTVNVINNANGTQATATEKNDNGVRVIDVLIEQVKDSIASDINRGNGQIPATMERKYGLNAAVGAMR